MYFIINNMTRNVRRASELSEADKHWMGIGVITVVRVCDHKDMSPEFWARGEWNSVNEIYAYDLDEKYGEKV